MTVAPPPPDPDHQEVVDLGAGADVRVLFDDEVHVHYGFVWLQPPGGGPGEPDLDLARRGQVNGLLGAMQPGWLHAVVGLHTGHVPLRVEELPSAPEALPDDGWEDVVEVSHELPAATAWLVPFDGGVEIAISTPGWHRLRWSAAGMDAARDQHTRMDEDPALDRYRLQLWSAPRARDAVLRQTSELAAYWHDHAGMQPADEVGRAAGG